MNLFSKHRWFLLLLFVSLILRLFVYTQIMNHGQHPDYYLYKEWIYKSYSYGINNVYSVHSPDGILDVDQPPGSIYILRGSYELFLLTTKTLTHFFHLQPGSTVWINDSLLIFFFRLPSIIADLLLGTCIYIFLKSKVKKSIALLCSAFYLLNPPILYNSTVWGQMDSINNLFFYVSLMLLIWKKQFWSLLFFALSLFTKISLLPLAPIYFLLMLFDEKFNLKSFLKNVLGVTIIFMMLCIPFWSSPLWIITTFQKIATGIDQKLTVNAYNFWWYILYYTKLTIPVMGTEKLFTIQMNTWAYILFSSICAPLVLYTTKLYRNKKLTDDSILFISFLTLFAAFLFLPKMHERYLYPIFPLFITWIGLKNKYWFFYIILSFFHFLNIYIVWNPDLFLFQRFQNEITNQRTIGIASFGTLLIFFLFYLKIFHFTFTKASRKN